MFKRDVNANQLPDSTIIQVGSKRETAELVEKFYTKNPFPNYDNFETLNDLNNKIGANVFTSSLKKSIGFSKRIIEVGSGTCQLSIALALGTNNEVVAFDPTLESLRLGAGFAQKHEVKNCTFVNGDLFSDPFEKGYFDVVWSSGVLHHTESAENGFKIITQWAKPHGYVIIGLYNLYGRMRTVFRQKLFRILGKGNVARSVVSLLDPVLRKNISEAKKEAWFQDQYEHPVETLHTFDEVLRWFDENGVDFVNAIPACNAGSVDYENLFSVQSRGSWSTRILSQVSMLFSPLGGEGGLFLVIGKKL
jgi:SAM-dependent methyltransferase